MEPQFWIERWGEGKIGFHEGTPNTFLVEFAGRLSGRRVLVPLCGKTEDLAYLASLGRDVLGIELVENAVIAFFTEHGIAPTITHRGSLAIYTAGPTTIIAGDLFAVTRDVVGPIDAIYDRAALIALPPELRPRYLAHLRTLVTAPTPTLLVALEYPQDRMEGPPFSVLETEVRTLYPHVEKLAERPAAGGRAGEVGAIERCYSVTL